MERKYCKKKNYKMQSYKKQSCQKCQAKPLTLDDIQAYDWDRAIYDNVIISNDMPSGVLTIGYDKKYGGYYEKSSITRFKSSRKSVLGMESSKIVRFLDDDYSK